MPRKFDKYAQNFERHMMREAIVELTDDETRRTLEMMRENESPEDLIKSDIGVYEKDGFSLVRDGDEFFHKFPDLDPDQPVSWQINIGKTGSDPTDPEEGQSYLNLINNIVKNFALKADVPMPSQSFHGQGTYEGDQEISIALSVFDETPIKIGEFLDALGRALPKEYCFAVKPATSFTLVDNPHHSPDGFGPGTEVKSSIDKHADYYTDENGKRVWKENWDNYQGDFDPNSTALTVLLKCVKKVLDDTNRLDPDVDSDVAAFVITQAVKVALLEFVPIDQITNEVLASMVNRTVSYIQQTMNREGEQNIGGDWPEPPPPVNLDPLPAGAADKIPGWGREIFRPGDPQWPAIEGLN